MTELSGVVLIDSKESLLLLHHKKHDHYQFPGGKIEKGETPEQACIREAQEEIDCKVKIIRPLLFGYFTSNGKKFKQHLFLVQIESNQIPTLAEPDIFDEIILLKIKFFKEHPKLAPNVREFCEQYLEGKFSLIY